MGGSSMATQKPGRVGSVWRLEDGSEVRVIGRYTLCGRTMLKYRHMKLHGNNLLLLEGSAPRWQVTELGEQLAERPDLPSVWVWLAAERRRGLLAAVSADDLEGIRYINSLPYERGGLANAFTKPPKQRAK